MSLLPATDGACPCGSGQTLAACCGRLHGGEPAADAERLMRSRYAAYVLGNIDYLRATTLPAQQGLLDLDAIGQWSRSSQWLGLEVLRAGLLHGESERAEVVFVARWRDATGEHRHEEHSIFVRRGGRWYFLDPTVRLGSGRNDPCPCGSGAKFKKCCSAYLA